MDSDPLCYLEQEGICFSTSGDQVDCEVQPVEGETGMTCPDGYMRQTGTINDAQVLNCVKEPSRTCQSGYSLDQASGQCIKEDACPSTHKFNTVSKICEPITGVTISQEGGTTKIETTTNNTTNNTSTTTSTSNNTNVTNNYEIKLDGKWNSNTSRKGFDSDMTEMDVKIEEAKQRLTDSFDQVKGEISEMFAFQGSGSASLDCSGWSTEVGVGAYKAQFDLCPAEYAPQLEVIASAIVFLSLLFGLFIIFR